MLHIRIICVGKLKERFWSDACAEYLKRLRPYAQVEVLEVADVDPTRAGGMEAAVNKEGESVLAAIPDGTHVVLMAIEGKPTSSEAFARKLHDWGVEGTNNIAFVIGGSDGVSAQVKARAQEKQSFGPITLPHNLARVVLLEQIYRAFKINRGEPYHK